MVWTMWPRSLAILTLILVVIVTCCSGRNLRRHRRQWTDHGLARLAKATNQLSNLTECQLRAQQRKENSTWFFPEIPKAPDNPNAATSGSLPTNAQGSSATHTDAAPSSVQFGHLSSSTPFPMHPTTNADQTTVSHSPDGHASADAHQETKTTGPAAAAVGGGDGTLLLAQADNWTLCKTDVLTIEQTRNMCHYCARLVDDVDLLGYYGLKACAALACIDPKFCTTFKEQCDKSDPSTAIADHWIELYEKCRRERIMGICWNIPP